MLSMKIGALGCLKNELALCLCRGGQARSRVGQNRIYTPYITVYLMISLPRVPFIQRI
jgi:hypothetical protein